METNNTNTQMMKDSVIILSGGMDSVTLLYEKKDSIALAISFDYGSNHNAKEIPFARLHCERLGIRHMTIPLAFVHDHFRSSLLEGAAAISEANRIRELTARQAVNERFFRLGFH